MPKCSSPPILFTHSPFDHHFNCGHWVQLARKAYPQAEALLLPGSGSFFAPAADMSPNERRLAVGHILNLYQALGKPEQAAVW